MMKTTDSNRIITFKIAKRYLRRFNDGFASCAHGDGWKLYQYTESIKDFHKRKPSAVGFEGRKSKQIASIEHIPDDIISENYWTNPEKI